MILNRYNPYNLIGKDNFPGNQSPFINQQSQSPIQQNPYFGGNNKQTNYYPNSNFNVQSYGQQPNFGG